MSMYCGGAAQHLTIYWCVKVLQLEDQWRDQQQRIVVEVEVNLKVEVLREGE